MPPRRKRHQVQQIGQVFDRHAIIRQFDHAQLRFDRSAEIAKPHFILRQQAKAVHILWAGNKRFAQLLHHRFQIITARKIERAGEGFGIACFQFGLTRTVGARLLRLGMALDQWHVGVVGHTDRPIHADRTQKRNRHHAQHRNARAACRPLQVATGSAVKFQNTALHFQFGALGLVLDKNTARKITINFRQLVTIHPHGAFITVGRIGLPPRAQHRAPKHDADHQYHNPKPCDLAKCHAVALFVSYGVL